MSKEKSEFGKGLAYNLVLFAMHFNTDMARDIANRHFVMNSKEKDKILAENPDGSHSYGFNEKVKWWFDRIVPIYGSAEEALRGDINVWANGASDHLYDINTDYGNNKLKKKLKELKDLGLDMGHGSGLMGRGGICNMENFWKLQELTKECALLLDKSIGIEVEKGEWE